MADIFRIRRPGTSIVAQAATADDFAAYMGRLIKLIPAEVLGVYQTLYGIFASPTPSAPPSAPLKWLPVLGFVLVIFVRAWGTRDASGSWATVQWIAVAISAVSFAIWILVSGHSILGYVLPDLRYGSALMVVWIFVLPYIYKGA
ncbi:MAG: hypothetical protein WC670_20185 [Pseudolabrys sp.]|jgi:hypothetical protein